LAAFATSEGYSVKPDAHVPFHGYFFTMLRGQSNKARTGAKKYLVDGKMVGGFAFVAFPAQYGNSGVMSFMINQEGVLLEKDLGKTTAEIATAMSEFDPGAGWSPIED
jgi:NADH:ubiquinone oxidoreductase subunit 2 (subunit N)